MRAAARNLAIAALGTSLLALYAQPSLAASTGSGPWQWTLTPYLWYPTINANMRFEFPPDDPSGGSSVDTEVGPSEYLTDLHGVLMVAAEARHGAWALLGDLIWLDLTTDTSNVRAVAGDGGTISVPRDTNLDTETDLSGFVVNLVGSRVIAGTDAMRVEGLAGARYFSLDTDLDWQLTSTLTGPGFSFASEGHLSGDIEMWDAVVGLRGRLEFGRGRHWYVPWYLDVGAGSSDFTWQALAGVGYNFEHAGVLFVWRQLDYERDEDDLLQEISFGGPGLGFSWRF